MNPPPSFFGPGRHPDAIDDPIHDPYQARQQLPSFTVCGECGALYADGHWQWASMPIGAAAAICPACQRMRDRRPAGDVTIDARLAGRNRAAIIALARNLEALDMREHPLHRIMAIEAADGAAGTEGALRITTTDPQLARRLGEELEQHLHGQASYAFARGEYLLRVDVKPEAAICEQAGSSCGTRLTGAR
jgi:hypothetical protein